MINIEGRMVSLMFEKRWCPALGVIDHDEQPSSDVIGEIIVLMIIVALLFSPLIVYGILKYLNI